MDDVPPSTWLLLTFYNRKRHKKKVVVAAHSMGSTVMLVSLICFRPLYEPNFTLFKYLYVQFVLPTVHLS